MTKYVIFDCDGGSDDAWALILLLKAEQEKRLIILGVTVCGCGNTDLQNAARNMYRILKACGREKIPIYFGAAEALLSSDDKEERYKFHGIDGFGDVLSKDDFEDVANVVESEHAVSAIYRYCTEQTKQVTVIAVGPLTNIALCYAMYGQQFADSVKDIFVMGGNHQGVGNFTRSAEFNFYSDPEAAQIVLTKSKCPLTILPWEPCMEDRFFICINWRLDVFGSEAAVINPAVEILNKVERAQWLPSSFKSWIPCDALLVAVFLFESQVIRKESMWHATVDLKGCHTRGQMVLDHLHEVEKYPKNLRVIELVDAKCFQSITQWAVGIDTVDLNLTNCLANGSSKSK